MEEYSRYKRNRYARKRKIRIRRVVTVLIVAFAVVLLVCLIGGGKTSGSSFDPESTAPIQEDALTPVIVSPTETPEMSAAVPEPAATPTATPSEQKLVEYTGPVEHFFTHYLIAYPEIALSKGSGADDLWNNCITPHELEAVLQSLYDNGYILVDYNTIYETDENGKSHFTSLMLPEGKKPMVFSIDDVIGTKRDRGRGTIDKYILGEDGKIWTYTLMDDGSESIRNDNDFIPIIDAFIEEHPDFSLNGARGIIATTGFNGLLGYDVTNESERAEVQPIVDYLLAEGWTFASHSFHHFHWEKITVEKAAADIEKWNDQIASICGPVEMFVWPYGEYMETSNEKYLALKDAGFRVFCGTYAKGGQIEWPDGTLLMERRMVDGYALDHFRETYLAFFDANIVRDVKRPAKGEVIPEAGY
ncbi:polysaccharide deacetylase family protein [Christensenella tenuis]|uniref:Polysaccharide deacetylase family protein n=1 Tax=Christensenella tenuis TaxID=2763033 RepID=A0ABR7EIM7_9FIRM|nr:polysaccharide deacetylase family protein [Christensenella tenuis]MBC5648994.1 polysaccharide deacetylase family protein [Christensenella tenuis]